MNITRLATTTILGLHFLLASALHGRDPVVRANDRICIAGDSITEQKKYSRFIEDYLTMCQPQLKTQVFQMGWNGETAGGFLKRMDGDMALFQPTLATFCYGMNDGKYKPYEPAIGSGYETPMRAILEKLDAKDIRVVLGGPGAMDFDFNERPVTQEQYNKNLATLSGIAKKLADEKGVPFADIHGPMFATMTKAKAALGKDYDVCGRDGIHPNDNGHLVMAYAFLKAMGFDGDLGSVTLDFKGPSSAANGHTLTSFDQGHAEIVSDRYPFCFSGDASKSRFAASILPFLPFQEELNRFTLVVRNAPAETMKVTWGNQTKSFSKSALEKGINLAAEFIPNPFNEQFMAVDAAIADKQACETKWVKVTKRFLDELRLANQDEPEAINACATLEANEAKRWQKKVQAVREQFKPVKHMIQVSVPEVASPSPAP